MSLKQFCKRSLKQSSLVMLFAAGINIISLTTVNAVSVVEINSTVPKSLSYSTQSDTTKASKKINTALLVGEWSQSGKCNLERFIYTSDGKYIWRKKEARTWRNQYKGIYMFQDRKVVVADGPNMGGAEINISSLTSKSFIGEWVATEELTFENPEDAKINYVKCKS